MHSDFKTKKLITNFKNEKLYIMVLLVHSSKLNQGFTLIEVLITVVVMAVGLLGLAGLQALSLRYNHDSALKNVATHQIQEIADRMRANQSGTSSGSYNNFSGQT